MNINKKYTFCLAVVSLFIFTQPVYSALLASLEQKVITIDHFVDNKKIIALDGSVFEINSPKVLKNAKKFVGQQIHVLYVNMGNKFIVSDLKPATNPPFTIPVKETIKNKRPN